MAMEWDGKVAPPTLRCCLDGRTLVAGERIVSALRLDDGRFVRDDCAETRWSDYDRARALSWWRSRVPAPRAQGGLVLDPAALLRVFDDLGSREDRPALVFRYLVGLCLMRMRRLVLVRFAGSGPGAAMVVARRGGGTLVLADPLASGDELAQAREDLLRVAGVDPGPAPAG